MENYSKYFANNRPKPKWFIGDRVFGYYNKIPFVGTVLNDHWVSEDEQPRVYVQLDLPLKCEKNYTTIVLMKQKDLKKLVKIKE